MKNIYLLIIVLGVLIAACFKTETPPVLTFDGEANMKIAELQKLHTINGNKEDTFIEDDIIITGIVTSTDQFGHCYKEIFIQDETGGISIRIDNNAYYRKYRIGQQIFVKMKGLYLGNYTNNAGTSTGFYQIGNSYGKGLGYISSRVENLHIFRHDVPKSRPEPKTIKYTDGIELNQYYHTWVRLENCYFTDADGTTKYWEPGTYATIDRSIKFNSGAGTVVARMGQYFAFKDSILPEGALNITGLFTKFGSTNQFIICDIKDVKSAPPPPPAKILKSFDMKTDPFTQGWTNKQVSGDAAWNWSQGSVMMNPAGKETQCWFISPKFNFTGEKYVTLTFSYRLNSGGTSDHLQAHYTIDGTTWNRLPFIPIAGAQNEITIDLEENIATNPNLQIAFKYETTSVYPMCAIFNVTFKANL